MHTDQDGNMIDVNVDEFLESGELLTDRVELDENGEHENPPAGCDILGWDIGGFHSFLCNSLQAELPEAMFNELGLLKNEFGEVADFARRIQGKGEPVEWIPCRYTFR